MRCRNCGAILPADTTICPVCEEETTKHPTNRIPRLLIGGAVVLLVCVCIVLGVLQQRQAQTSPDREIDVAAFSLIDPEEDEATGASSALSLAEGCYALTDPERHALGTYRVSSLRRQDFSGMDMQSLAAFWNEAAGSDELYTTVRFEDGTGIVFCKGNSSTADFGTLDTHAYIADVYGMLLREEDGTITYVESVPGHGNPLTESETAATLPAVGNVIITSEAQTSAQNEPSEETESEPEEPSVPAETVYITDSGEKFHRSGCSYLNDNAHALPRAQAEEKGYTACSRCQP